MPRELWRSPVLIPRRRRLREQGWHEGDTVNASSAATAPAVASVRGGIEPRTAVESSDGSAPDQIAIGSASEDRSRLQYRATAGAVAALLRFTVVPRATPPREARRRRGHQDGRPPEARVDRGRLRDLGLVLRRSRPISRLVGSERSPTPDPLFTTYSAFARLLRAQRPAPSSAGSRDVEASTRRSRRRHLVVQKTAAPDRDRVVLFVLDCGSRSRRSPSSR